MQKERFILVPGMGAYNLAFSLKPGSWPATNVLSFYSTQEMKHERSRCGWLSGSNETHARGSETVCATQRPQLYLSFTELLNRVSP